MQPSIDQDADDSEVERRGGQESPAHPRPGPAHADSAPGRLEDVLASAGAQQSKRPRQWPTRQVRQGLQGSAAPQAKPRNSKRARGWLAQAQADTQQRKVNRRLWCNECLCRIKLPLLLLTPPCQ